MTEALISRRSILRGALLSVLAGVAGYAVGANSAVAKAKNGTTASNAYGPSPSGGRRLLAEVAQIPLGGGVVLASAKVVLSRSPSGAVHGFSAICTHQGCTVGSVRAGEILCPCHGSRFSAETGAVTSGPATIPLPTVPVVVDNGGVYTA